MTCEDVERKFGLNSARAMWGGGEPIVHVAYQVVVCYLMYYVCTIFSTGVPNVVALYLFVGKMHNQDWVPGPGTHKTRTQ